MMRTLSALERDALREVANIGAGHAATALSQLTGGRIMISVPEVILVQLNQLADVIGPLDTPVTAVVMRVMGDFTGTTVLVCRQPSAHALCGLLLGKMGSGPAGEGSGFDPMEQSTLKETGNILCSAYLNALSDFLGMMLLPSVPELVVDSVGAALNPPKLRVESPQNPVFCVETAFRIEGSEQSHSAQFLLLPDPVALDVIFDAISIAS